MQITLNEVLDAEQSSADDVKVLQAVLSDLDLIAPLFDRIRWMETRRAVFLLSFFYLAS